MLQSFLLFPSLFVTLSTQLHVSSSSCKAQAGSPQWPSLQTWEKLNATLSGALLQPLPPASACFPNVSTSDDGARCKQVTDSWYQSEFHSNDPVSVVYPNWQKDACLPPTLHNQLSSCDIKPFPNYVVNASTVAHVVEAVKFASTNNMRLIVKGSGHDLLGRSTAPSSISIWTHHLKGLTYEPSFSTSCADSGRVAAITAYSGHNMEDIYINLAEHNMTFVGAADPNVGIGGYLTGGGHSPLGSKYGMAVDNVLEIGVVTPNGSVVVANACENADLFWAMRGGGGATFGVIIYASLRAHPMPSLTFARFLFDSTETEAETNDNKNFFAAVAHVHSQLPTLSKAGLAGYFSMMPTPKENSSRTMNFGFLIYSLTSTTEILDKALDPIMTRLNSSTGITTSNVMGTFPSFEAFRSIFMTAAPVGTNSVSASRLWDVNAVTDEARLISALTQLSNEYLVGTFVSGEGVHKVSTEKNALNPAWRRTVVHMRTDITFPLGSTTAEFESAMMTADNLSAVLRAQAPDMGCYVNEAHVREPDFQKAFWGDHYEKLLDMKRKIDPLGVFWCPVCVGAEEWSSNDEGKLCRI